MLDWASGGMHIDNWERFGQDVIFVDT